MVAHFFRGPPCTTVSTAGKQLGADDPQSACINGFLEIASFFGAQMALMENVSQLITDDHRHGLFSSALRVAEERELPLLGHFELVDSHCGGHSQRRRTWVTFEASALTHMLPAWAAPAADGDPLPINDAQQIWYLLHCGYQERSLSCLSCRPEHLQLSQDTSPSMLASGLAQ